MNTKSTKTLWLTDLHLDLASEAKQNSLLSSLRSMEYKNVLITGDISNAGNLTTHLQRLASACAPRQIYMVLGNHDFYGSSFSEVDAEVAKLCDSVTNLHHLDGSKILPLGDGIGVMGHRGWADARAGYGFRTAIDSPDRPRISDFRGLDRNRTLLKMSELGAESARSMRKTLPLALTRYRRVVILTHVPPFPQAVFYNRKPCKPTLIPHFSNVSAGLAIRAITRAFGDRRVTILSGHSHSSKTVRILPNLTIHVGGARTGRPGWLKIIDLNES